MLQAEGIYKVYENRTIAVRNISVSFQEVGFVAIVGKSGCGKSTLLNLLSNNDTVTKGKITFCGKAYDEWDSEQLRKEFSYIYQDFKLIEKMTVYQNILLGQELACKEINHDTIANVAEQLGIGDLLDQKVYALSGGQQQRVAIARAMVRKPKVIFADEPTGNLDSENANNVFEILKQISQTTLVVVVSHDENIVKFADRMLEIENGKLVNDYLVEEQGREELFRDIYAKRQAEKESANFDTQSNAENAANDKENEKTNLSVKSDTENKAQPQINDKQPSKIDTKSIFSYKKSKNKVRKTEGLSAKSAAALTIAFTKRGTAKKLVLLILSVIMIMLIFMSTAVIFTSPEKTFCHIMRVNKTPFVQMRVFDRNGELSVEERAKIQEYIKQQTGENITEISSTFLHRNTSYISPVDIDAAPHYASKMRFSDTIYSDNPDDLGLKILIGEAPKVNSEGIPEIAISKTFYDYFMTVKRFRNAEEEIVDFASVPLIGSYIKEFRFKISGVFEDYNDYDMNTKAEEWDLYAYNDLCYKIIRPTAAKADYLSLCQAYYGKLRLYFNSFNDPFLGFAPCNQNVKRYFYNCAELNEDLAQDEIYVDSWFAMHYKLAFGKDLQVGDTLQFDFVKSNHGMFGETLGETMQKNVKFKVKGIVDGLDGYVDIVVNDTVYQNWVVDATEYFNIAIKSKYVTPKFMKNLRDFVYYELSPRITETVQTDWQHDNFSVDFDMIKHNGNDEYYNDIIDIARFYIAIPLCVLALVAFGILVTVLISDLIKENGKDILILRSLGAKNKDLWKIFGVVALVMLAIQFVAGSLLGGALVHGLNLFWTMVGDYEFYTPTFFISALSVVVMLVATLSVFFATMCYNIQKMSGKNLRKSFQKQKK